MLLKHAKLWGVLFALVMGLIWLGYFMMWGKSARIFKIKFCKIVKLMLTILL